jgi:hypothetical protein
METKIKFSISYEELLKVHEDKAENFDKAYYLILNKNPWQNPDNIIEFLRRWNTRVPIKRNKGKIEGTINSLKSEFDSLKTVKLENFNEKLDNIEITERIFEKLSRIELKTPKGKIIRLKSTGVSKIMHAINQNLFVMWDNGIAEYYGCATNAKGYIRFMETMQDMCIELLNQHNGNILKETGRTIPKLLDEYNWMKFSSSKMKEKDKVRD